MNCLNEKLNTNSRSFPSDFIVFGVRFRNLGQLVQNSCQKAILMNYNNEASSKCLGLKSVSAFKLQP